MKWTFAAVALAALALAAWLVWPAPDSAPSGTTAVPTPALHATLPADAGGCSLRGHLPSPPAADRVVVRVMSPRSPAAPPAEHYLALEGASFSAPVLVIRRGDTVVVVNQDSELHHLSANPFELTQAKAGALGHHRFDRLGSTRIQCANHSSERADVLIVDTEHWAFVKPDGAWRLSDVPDGPKTLEVWDPDGTTQQLNVDGCGEVFP